MQKKGVHKPHKLHAPLVLSKKPKGATVIEGFPGLGLVGTIATGFLLDHLKCEKIGSYYFEDPPATLAVHGCTIVDPIGIYYNKEYNLVIVHAITSAAGIEFAAADLILNLCGQIKASQIITIEGVGSTEIEETRGFFYTDHPQLKKTMENLGIDCLGEGIIMGVTAALLMRSKYPMLSLFAETHSKLPDSKAAAKIIEILDRLLGLKVNYEPLLKQAEEFEKKLKGMLEQTMKAREMKDKK
ncbi:MAG: PAC2 family protein, partial [Candidatus Woesearchaeota archaeon]